MIRYSLVIALLFLPMSQQAIAQSNNNFCYGNDISTIDIKNTDNVDIENKAIKIPVAGTTLEVCYNKGLVTVNNLSDKVVRQLTCLDMSNLENKGVGYYINNASTHTGLWLVVDHTKPDVKGRIQIGVYDEGEETMWLVTNSTCEFSAEEKSQLPVEKKSVSEQEIPLETVGESEVKDELVPQEEIPSEKVASSCSGAARHISLVSDWNNVDIKSNPVQVNVGSKLISVCAENSQILLENLTDKVDAAVTCLDLTSAEARKNEGVGYKPDASSLFHMWLVMNHGKDSNRQVEIGVIETNVADGKPKLPSKPWIITSFKC